MDFGRRLRDLRKLNNYTQEELAKLVGVTAGAIGLYEQNRREPDNETVKKIATIFDVTIDYLLGFEIINEMSHYNGTNPLKKDISNLVSDILNKTDDITKLELLKNVISGFED